MTNFGLERTKFKIMSQLFSPSALAAADIVCFSHLRWDFVYQRPQHLMSRFARDRRVFFVEEPVIHDGEPGWVFSTVEVNVTRCVPKLADTTTDEQRPGAMQFLVNSLADKFECHECVEWFYTPMMLDWALGLSPVATVYDCMDELSKFRFAPGGIVDMEQRLFEKADLVFTGGHSLYKAKRAQHAAVHEFPSSIDSSHFRRALFEHEEMPEQVQLPHPRIGYAGVIDERIDLDLVAAAADLKPDWSFIMLGPVVKIDPESLPQRPNIHYLGMKEYGDLPRYFAGWDVGMMPFALNESTEFISPTKTPEYLAAGLAVISTPITDVIRPYGELGLVEIIADAHEFVDSVNRALTSDKVDRLRKADIFLSERSWDGTQRAMNKLINSLAKNSRLTGTARKAGSQSSLRYAA